MHPSYNQIILHGNMTDQECFFDYVIHEEISSAGLEERPLDYLQGFPSR